MNALRPDVITAPLPPDCPRPGLLDPVNAPWLVVDQAPAPLLFLRPDGSWTGNPAEAGLHFDANVAYWLAEEYQADLMPAEAVVG